MARQEGFWTALYRGKFCPAAHSLSALVMDSSGSRRAAVNLDEGQFVEQAFSLLGFSGAQSFLLQETLTG
jgi:hypothetical protein